jgi:prophage regulatory protein
VANNGNRANTEFQALVLRQFAANIMDKNRSDVMRVLRLAEVIEKTGLARSTIYKYADLGRFPRPISLGGKSVGWIDSEIHEWLQDKQVERDIRHGPSKGWGR